MSNTNIMRHICEFQFLSNYVEKLKKKKETEAGKISFIMYFIK